VLPTKGNVCILPAPQSHGTGKLYCYTMQGLKKALHSGQHAGQVGGGAQEAKNLNQVGPHCVHGLIVMSSNDSDILQCPLLKGNGVSAP
jgi:hypothetical protein